MDGVAIEPLSSRDLEAVAGLHTRSWHRTYRGILADDFLDGDLLGNRRRLWTQRLLDAPAPNAFGFVATRHGEALGFAYAYQDEHAQRGSLLDNLHVHPDHQGRGLGRRLLRAVAQRHLSAGGQALHLFVLDANQAARDFYARLGAEFVERCMSPPLGGRSVPEWCALWRDPTPLAQ